jgi:hypothetical protein
MRSLRFAALVTAAAAVLLLFPSLIWGPAPIDSAVYNYVWTKQFGAELARGVLYPRWLPGSFQGLGSPTFYFYPPIAFYLSGLLQAAGLSTLQAVNGAALLALFASGLSMWAWLRFKGANPLWALLYMAAPYHLTDWYQRAALAEFAAFAWLPLIALAIEAQPRRWATPLLAVAFAGLVMTHLPVALLTCVGLIAPMVLARREHLAAYAMAGALGLGLSAIYLLPALTLQDRISTEALFSPFYRPASWAPWGPNAALWVLPLALCPAALALGRSRFWLALTLFAAAMSLALIPFVWSLPAINQVQFPWRMLVVAEFAAVTAVALSPPRLVVLALALALSAPAYARAANVAVHSLANTYGPEIDRDLPDAAEYLPAGSYVSDITAQSRVVDLSKATVPSLGPGPVRETIWGAWISALAVLGWLATWRKPVFRVPEARSD